MHWREKGKVLRVLPSGCSSSIVNLGNAQEKYRFSLVYFFFLVSPIFSMNERCVQRCDWLIKYRGKRGTSLSSRHMKSQIFIIFRLSFFLCFLINGFVGKEKLSSSEESVDREQALDIVFFLWTTLRKWFSCYFSWQNL